MKSEISFERIGGNFFARAHFFAGPAGLRSERGEKMNSAVPNGGILSEADLEAMIDRYGDGLLRVCLLYLKDYASAEDAVQETFLRAYRKFETFEGRCSVKTWLTTIAINVCRNMLRAPWSRRTVGEDALLSLKAADPATPDPTVARAVMKLPRDQRAAVVLYYVQGLKIREIAQVMGVPVPTVSSRLSRAKQKLHAELKEWYFDEE